MLERLIDFFNSQQGVAAYLLLFLFSLGENLFPPLPGDTMVVMGAIMVGRGLMDFVPAFIATTTGSLAGFMLLFYVGYRLGTGFLTARRSRVFAPDYIRKAEAWIDKYGYKVLALNRFLSGFRAVISFVAGMERMNPRKVFGLALISCILWNFFLMGMGMWAGQNWETIISHYQRSIVILFILIILFVVVRGQFRKRTQVS